LLATDEDKTKAVRLRLKRTKLTARNIASSARLKVPHWAKYIESPMAAAKPTKDESLGKLVRFPATADSTDSQCASKDRDTDPPAGVDAERSRCRRWQGR